MAAGCWTVAPRFDADTTFVVAVVVAFDAASVDIVAVAIVVVVVAAAAAAAVVVVAAAIAVVAVAAIEAFVVVPVAISAAVVALAVLDVVVSGLRLVLSVVSAAPSLLLPYSRIPFFSEICCWPP